jgi:endonuclease YncB( thermonuclease family)
MSKQSRKLIEESDKSKATIGRAGLGLRGQTVMSPAFAVHDGDTIFARALANISLRFLGVDTPEVAFTLPEEFTPPDQEPRPTLIKDEQWETFLSGPFANWPDAKEVLGADLHAYLVDHTGPGTAANHAKLAEIAEDTLEGFVKADVTKFANGSNSEFVFFLRYAKDVIDRYGRLLAYLTVNVDKNNLAAAPKLSCNERMLEEGTAAPYFIWPNLDPFKQQPTLLDAVPAPDEMTAVANSGRLKKARQLVAAARDNDKGIFGQEPLRLQPFELRYLAGKRGPDRPVIDMASNDGVILDATDYPTIEKIEDRLYIPAEYVPLFENHGWQRSTP